MPSKRWRKIISSLDSYTYLTKQSNRRRFEKDILRHKFSWKGSLSPPSPGSICGMLHQKKSWPQKKNTWAIVNMDPTQEDSEGKEHPGWLWREQQVQIVRQGHPLLYVPIFKHMKVNSPHCYWWDSYWWWPMSETKWWRIKNVPNVNGACYLCLNQQFGRTFDPQRAQQRRKHKCSHWMKFHYIALSSNLKDCQLQFAIYIRRKDKQPRLRI